MKNLKMGNICLGLLVSISVSTAVNADNGKFDRTKYLKDYAGDTLVASQVIDWNEAGVLIGGNAQGNAKAVLQNFNCIQPNIYSAWRGFWPADYSAADLDQLMSSLDFVRSGQASLCLSGYAVTRQDACMTLFRTNSAECSTELTCVGVRMGMKYASLNSVLNGA